MLLFINTSDQQEAQLALVSGEIVWHKFAAANLSENLILEIKKFLQKQQAGWDQIQQIAVVTGPGPFSKIRTAVATANALAFSLKISIVGMAKGELPHDLRKLLSFKSQKMIQPYYDREPNITKPRK